MPSGYLHYVRYRIEKNCTNYSFLAANTSGLRRPCPSLIPRLSLTLSHGTCIPGRNGFQKAKTSWRSSSPARSRIILRVSPNKARFFVCRFKARRARLSTTYVGWWLPVGFEIWPFWILSTPYKAHCRFELFKLCVGVHKDGRLSYHEDQKNTGR